MGQKLSGGVVHDLPEFARNALLAAPDAARAWEDITPLARNEFICWITSAKQEATQLRRLRIACENLAAGKRRPCCWPGCPHR